MLLIGLSLVTAAAARDGVQRFFSYGKNPSTGLISVTFESTFPTRRTRFTVFNDGRVEIRQYQVSAENSRLMRTLEARLDEGELTRMIEDSVNSGLATYDPVVAAARLNVPRVGVSDASESSGVEFELELDHLAEGSGPGQEPFRNSFASESPELLARQYPDEPAFIVFRSICRRLRELEQNALLGETQ
jgi:hypothetical protein